MMKRQSMSSIVFTIMYSFFFSLILLDSSFAFRFFVLLTFFICIALHLNVNTYSSLFASSKKSLHDSKISLRSSSS